MNPHIRISTKADADLAETFAWLGEHSGVAVADRFLMFFRKSCLTLLQMPSLGSPRRFRFTNQPHLAEIRQWPVRSFTRYLIFYRPISDGIEVVRVLHTAQNIESLFEDGEDQPEE